MEVAHLFENLRLQRSSINKFLHNEGVRGVLVQGLATGRFADDNLVRIPSHSQEACNVAAGHYS